MDVRSEDIPYPECGEGEMLVKVDGCAVCGSDMKAYKSGNPRMQPPITMGHEFAGKVVENRYGKGYSLGDRIVMATSIACGKCGYCKCGWRNLCANVRPMGFGYNGGMAEYVVIPQLAIDGGHVIKVPTSIDPIHAALAEPVSCAVNSCENANVRPGSSVLVMGAGPMGILNALVAREFGAAKVFMSEINPARLAQCHSFGFDRLINPAIEDIEKVIRMETDGLGVDVVIVAAPAAFPQEQALTLVRKRGTVCLFASLPVGSSELKIDSRLIHYNEIRLVGTSDSTPAQVEKAVAIIDRDNFPADRIVTHTLPLTGFKQAIELMSSGEALRVVLIP
jgi:L-iditol 2-dehydrogenase